MLLFWYFLKLVDFLFFVDFFFLWRFIFLMVFSVLMLCLNGLYDMSFISVWLLMVLFWEWFVWLVMVFFVLLFVILELGKLICVVLYWLMFGGLVEGFLDEYICCILFCIFCFIFVFDMIKLDVVDVEDFGKLLVLDVFLVFCRLFIVFFVVLFNVYFIIVLFLGFLICCCFFFKVYFFLLFKRLDLIGMDLGERFW